MEVEEDQIGSPYIPRISPKMFENMYPMVCMPVLNDIEFLKLFVELCLERLDFTSDEESREIFRSMMTALEVIWIEDPILDRTRKLLPSVIWIEDPILDAGDSSEEGDDVQLLPSVIVELERRIRQTKLLMEGWCVSLLSNSLMRCKPSSFHDVKGFLTNLKDDFLKELHLKNAGICSFEYFSNNIDILNHLPYNPQYSTDSIEFLNFACDFSNRAACFICLAWAKEATDEKNIVFFNMIHKFIPSAPDVIACYFRILRSSTENFHSFLLQEKFQWFVEFFFGYLKITLMDEFPILIDQLIYLFTFISDHPRVNAAEEEDLIIRSQIYALFREDVYPLLSFNEMKEDKNNILLRDFMKKIEIVNAKLRHRYFVFSYSWIGSEAVKMDYFYSVKVKRKIIKHIEHIERSWWHIEHIERRWWHIEQSVRNQLLLYVMELGFLMESLLWFAMLDEEIKSRLNLVIISLQKIWVSPPEISFSLFEDRQGKRLAYNIFDLGNWIPVDEIAYTLEGKIELSKIEISTQLVNGFDWSLRSQPSTSNKVLKFLDSILHNLKALLRYKGSVILLFQKQIEKLEYKLLFMQNIMKLIENCTSSKDLGEFIIFVHDFAKQAARLTILYWLKEANDKTATEISLILSHTLHKIKPSTPCVARLYFETFKALYLHPSDPFLFGHSVTVFVDILFEDSVTDFKDEFKILQDDVIFLLTFLNDKGGGNVEELIDNSFWRDVYGILPIDDMKRDFSHKMVGLTGFMMKIETINAKIRKLYGEFPDSSLYDLPKITSPWYLDFLVKNLRNLIERMNTDRKFVPFVKYKITIFEQELVSLSPLFNYIFELQNELNDIWLQVVDVVHLMERVINSCISSWFVFDHPIWYYMAYLSHVFDKIKNIKKKIEKVKEKNMHNVCSLPRSAGVIGTRVKQEWCSEIDEVVVGFDDMARKLIDDFIGEHKPLDIVSIVGMGGLGKTTLARKVSSSVRDNFNILVFHTVSQDVNIRMLLLGILKQITKDDAEFSRMDDDDLAHKLWKCLSRQKYLIVLDDIWSTSVWNVVQRSFPDNKNGSRVMLTTRLKDVANECKLKCSPFEMPFISDVESWELLQKKVFENGISPPHLSNIGRHIAESCKGLPLAIVVIAGVLARKERSEGSWSEIAENLFSFLSDEGCMKILELSYNHLPEYLKPCILYLGAFPEDKLFRVNQLKRLWIAEGFIPEYETKSVEDLAKEYFQELVDRSLIIVHSRGSDGEIKTCNVHDLIHKLCQTKCQEGNFFNIGRGISASTSDNCYRISDLAVPLTISGGSSSLENASTLLLFTDEAHQDSSFLPKLKLVQVFYFENKYLQDWNDRYLTFLISLVNLRHVEYHSYYSNVWLPPSISNLWNIQSLILTGKRVGSVPETLWKMKSLRHVEVGECRLQFSDDHEHEQLDKVISFSTQILLSGKEVEQLLQRLPVVRKLGIRLSTPIGNDYLNTLDIFRKLESLNIHSVRGTYLINFLPSTLKKLTLEGLHLPRISLIAELKCLRVLKLRSNFSRGDTLEMEDVVFSNLVFFELSDRNLEEWNASIESFPCLEQLFIKWSKLEELPSCLGEVSTLKRIVISYSSIGVYASVLRIREELRDLGNKVEVTIAVLIIMFSYEHAFFYLYSR